LDSDYEILIPLSVSLAPSADALANAAAHAAVALNENSVAWVASEINQWMQTRIASRNHRNLFTMTITRIPISEAALAQSIEALHFYDGIVR
jgi:hypothetical protein